jgi:hypothetical protein
MEQASVMPSGQPVLGDKGYELFVDGQWWSLGLNQDCQTVAGALDHWRQRLKSLDEDISGRRASLAALTSGFDDPAGAQTEQQAKQERELLFLGRVRKQHEATLSMLEQCDTGSA